MDTIPSKILKSTFKNRCHNKATELGDNGKVFDYLFEELVQANAYCCALQTKVQILEYIQTKYHEQIANLLEQLGIKKDWCRIWKK